MVRISARVANVNVSSDGCADIGKKVEAALVKSFPNSKWDVQVCACAAHSDVDEEHYDVDCYEVSAIREADACKVVEKALANEFGAKADIYAR